MKVVIIMGSKGDLEWCKRIANTLEFFEVPYTMRVASAHKVPLKVLDIIKDYEKEDVVFITVAGRSNALSGFTDANTTKPVIACPPYSDKFSGVDVFSTLRMPSGVAPLTVLEPEEAALSAIKILALKYPELNEKVRRYQEEKRAEIEKADEEVRSHG